MSWWRVNLAWRFVVTGRRTRRRDNRLEMEVGRSAATMWHRATLSRWASQTYVGSMWRRSWCNRERAGETREIWNPSVRQLLWEGGLGVVLECWCSTMAIVCCRQRRAAGTNTCWTRHRKGRSLRTPFTWAQALSVTTGMPGLFLPRSPRGNRALPESSSKVLERTRSTCANHYYMITSKVRPTVKDGLVFFWGLG